MRYLSLFSGIEAATVAWHPLGWECVAVAEVEQFPCAVLAHHYPDVPNLGDVTKITESDIAALGPIDLVVFGSPCQDLSVAGHRKGLQDEHGNATRSGLFFTAINIVHWAKQHCGCRFALWENVPGAYSSNKGRDFASVVEWMAGMDECPVPPRGWATEGVAVGDNGLLEWACLDAQWFGVAQRRRRVFALADFGDWANRPPILLEPEGLRGDTAPSREKREEVTEIAGTLAANGGGLNRPAGNGNELDFCVVWPADVAPTLNAHFGEKLGLENQHALNGAGLFVPDVFARPIAFHYNAQADQLPSSDRDTSISDSLTCSQQAAVATLAPTLTASNDPSRSPQSSEVTRQVEAVHAACMEVRRLTPVECERLQGFPDGYTNIPWRKSNQSPDGPRYKALGNSMAVPVMRWIGKQIESALTKGLPE